MQPLLEGSPVSTRSSALLARSLAAVRRWLRHTWISRVPLGEGPGGRRDRQRAGQKPYRSPFRSLRPELELFEDRSTPNDLFGVLGASLLGGGMAYLGGDLLTPGAVLVQGWSGARAGADLPAPVA